MLSKNVLKYYDGSNINSISLYTSKSDIKSSFVYQRPLSSKNYLAVVGDDNTPLYAGLSSYDGKLKVYTSDEGVLGIADVRREISFSFSRSTREESTDVYLRLYLTKITLPFAMPDDIVVQICLSSSFSSGVQSVRISAGTTSQTCNIGFESSVNASNLTVHYRVLKSSVQYTNLRVKWGTDRALNRTATFVCGKTDSACAEKIEIRHEEKRVDTYSTVTDNYDSYVYDVYHNTSSWSASGRTVEFTKQLNKISNSSANKNLLGYINAGDTKMYSMCKYNYQSCNFPYRDTTYGWPLIYQRLKIYLGSKHIKTLERELGYDCSFTNEWTIPMPKSSTESLRVLGSSSTTYSYPYNTVIAINHKTYYPELY